MPEPVSAELSESEGALQVVYSPDAAALGRVIPLDRERVLSLGRTAPEPRGLIDDPRLSRVHADVVYEPAAGGYVVTDARSRNGTFVNGRLVEAQGLEEQHVVRIGDTLLVYWRTRPMTALRARVAALAPTDRSVLFVGESGVDSEHFARLLHDLSRRPGRFLSLDCSSAPRELMAAELFGHAPGAVAGADRERPGLLLSADRGTLLLDRVEALPPEQQRALLQALTEKTVTAVGSEQAAPISARVVASTEADLNQLALRSEFSADLLVALAGERLDVLPLRRRREEILVLATDLALARFRELRLTADAAEALLCWQWPANVRELDALLALYATLGPTGGVDADFLYDVKGDVLQGLAIAEEPDEPDAKDPAEGDLRQALDECQGKMGVAARQLGLSRQKLYRLMKQAGLEPNDFRPTGR